MTCLRSPVSRSEVWGRSLAASSCSESFFWFSSRRRAWSRISVISSENRFAAPLRSSSRRSLNCRPARAPSVRACGRRPSSSASEAWRTCSRLWSTCWRASAIRSRFSSRSIRSRSSSVSRRICCCWSLSLLSCRSISSRAGCVLAASRADCSSLSRSFTSFWRWASSRRRLRTWPVSRCSCSRCDSFSCWARAVR